MMRGEETAMAEQLLQVNFGLNVTPGEYHTICQSVADAFAQVPGLRWKLWIVNEQRREAGGVYLFEDHRALDAFVASDLAKAVATNPALKNVTMKSSAVMTDVSAVTRAPLAAPANV